MSKTSSSAAEAAPRPPRTVAVIDIGTASIRMAIAEIGVGGVIRTLEPFNRAVSIGRDSFTTGRIQQSTIEECVEILLSFRRALREYGVADPADIRAVATSAVREAVNRDQFLDRVYSATGIEVEAIDEMDVSRLTYLMAIPAIRGIPRLWDHPTLVIEIGGGSTEILMLEQGMVKYSGTYRMGTLRMREMLDAYRAPAASLKNVMKTHIQRTVDQIRHAVGQPRSLNLLFIGGDARFAATHFHPDWRGEAPVRIEAPALGDLAEDVLACTDDELVQRFRVAYSDAGSLGPALLAMGMLARAFALRMVAVSSLTLRDGLLQELASERSWTADFRAQMLRSALDLGRRFHFDEAHATHVAELCRQLFAQLQPLHGLDERYDLLLHIAALLHEIGLVIATRSHHKHSMYLILNSELFGLGKRDQLLVALVARYHRRASPQIEHEGYSQLNRGQRIVVAKLAALLRVADALDRGHGQRINDLVCRVNPDRVTVTVSGGEDVTVERLAMNEKGGLFQEIYGLPMEVRARRGESVK